MCHSLMTLILFCYYYYYYYYCYDYLLVNKFLHHFRFRRFRGLPGITLIDKYYQVGEHGTFYRNLSLLPAEQFLDANQCGLDK